MKYFLFFLTFIFIVVFYQNCSQPIRDLEAQKSKGTCLESPQTVGITYQPIANSDYEVALGNVGNDQFDIIRWRIGRSFNETTNENRLIVNVPSGQSVSIEAIATKQVCDSIQFQAEDTINNSSAGCNTNDLHISANQVVEPNSDLIITLENASNLKDIRWEVDDNPAGSNQDTYTFNRSIEKTYQVQAFAKHASNGPSCSELSSQILDIQVATQDNPANTSADLITRNPSDGICVPGSGEGRCSVEFRLQNINELPSNKKFRIHAYHMANNTYNLNAVTCQASSANFNFNHIYPGGIRMDAFLVDRDMDCHGAFASESDLLANPKIASVEARAKCGVNHSLSGGKCQVVGDGYYSPNKNNSKIACTNPKPNNSFYSDMGTNGTDNCPWECKALYKKQNGQCVAYNEPARFDSRNNISFSGVPSTCEAVDHDSDTGTAKRCQNVEVTIYSNNTNITSDRFIQVHVYHSENDTFNTSPMFCVPNDSTKPNSIEGINWIHKDRTIVAFYADKQTLQSLDTNGPDDQWGCYHDLPDSFFRDPNNYIKSKEIRIVDHYPN